MAEEENTTTTEEDTLTEYSRNPISERVFSYINNTGVIESGDGSQITVGVGGSGIA